MCLETCKAWHWGGSAVQKHFLTLDDLSHSHLEWEGFVWVGGTAWEKYQSNILASILLSEPLSVGTFNLVQIKTPEDTTVKSACTNTYTYYRPYAHDVRVRDVIM